MNRSALLKLLVLMLYAGPLVAGLAGQGWGVVPAFVAVFVLWQVIMRPADWPRDPVRWATAQQIALTLARVALVAALVAVMFGLGRGLGGIAGYLPAVPTYLPLALSFLSVPLARLVWDPARAAEMDAFLTDAIDRINGMTAAADESDDVAAAVGPLLILPDDAPDATARAGIGAILAEGNTVGRVRALTAALAAAPGRHPAARRGLILWATERPVAEAWIDRALPTDAFAAAGDDPALLRLFADNALPLIRAEPELWPDFPGTALVREMAVRVADPATARLLGELAEAQDTAEATLDARRAEG